MVQLCCDTCVFLHTPHPTPSSIPGTTSDIVSYDSTPRDQAFSALLYAYSVGMEIWNIQKRVSESTSKITVTEGGKLLQLVLLPACCYRINSHDQVCGYRIGSSHSGVEEYPRDFFSFSSDKIVLRVCIRRGVTALYPSRGYTPLNTLDRSITRSLQS